METRLIPVVILAMGPKSLLISTSLEADTEKCPLKNLFILFYFFLPKSLKDNSKVVYYSVKLHVCSQ